MLSIFFPLYPRKAMSVVLSIANLNLVLTCLTTSQYLSFLFLAMRSANLLINCLHSFDIPPDVRNTAGVKVLIMNCFTNYFRHIQLKISKLCHLFLGHGDEISGLIVKDNKHCRSPISSVEANFRRLQSLRKVNIGPRFFEVQDFQNQIRNVKGLSQNSGPTISSKWSLEHILKVSG